jgi:NADH:ubiquinone oxidoreductase subunit 5 (subunit L)/multisubunit Na+/H+ antiporter MnhA subunit
MIAALLAGFVGGHRRSYYSQGNTPYTLVISLRCSFADFWAYLASYIPAVANGEVISNHYIWFPELDIHIGFLIDGLSLIFALIVSGIGALIVFYGSSYLEGHHKQGRFYSYLFFFMASMLGVVFPIT